VRDYVRPRRQARKEAFVPLAHPPGHAQADFGEGEPSVAPSVRATMANAVLGGTEQKIRFFVMDLPQSDAIFVKAYHAETAEACLATATSRPSFGAALGPVAGCPLTLRRRAALDPP
jgi:transposase